MIRKRGRGVLFFLVVLLIPTVLAEDVKITFQPTQPLYHVGDTVVVDVSLESNRAAPSDFPIATFQLFVEHDGGTRFNFITPTTNDNQNNFFSRELQNNEFLSVSRWSMGDTVTETPATLSISPVRIGSLRGTALDAGTFSLLVPSDTGIYFRTGTGPSRIDYTYESTPLSITILNTDEECLNDAHCASAETCVSNQCQTIGAAASPQCGDGTQNGDETCVTCPVDAGACPVGDADGDTDDGAGSQDDVATVEEDAPTVDSALTQIRNILENDSLRVIQKVSAIARILQQSGLIN